MATVQIRFDEIYIFCSKTKPEVFLYKVEPITDHSKFGFVMGENRRWKKVTLEQFNQMGLTLVGYYER